MKKAAAHKDMMKNFDHADHHKEKMEHAKKHAKKHKKVEHKHHKSK